MATNERPKRPASSGGWHYVTGPLYMALTFQVVALLRVVFSDRENAGTGFIGGTIG